MRIPIYFCVKGEYPFSIFNSFPLKSDTKKLYLKIVLENKRTFAAKSLVDPLIGNIFSFHTVN